MATPYEQPANVLSRVRYYDGEFLKDEDLIAEQQFHIDGKWRHDRLLHAPGIAEGLAVSLTQDAAGTVRLQVSAGTAVDSQGRTILLGTDRSIDINPEWSGERWVAIRFNEQEDRFVQEDSATGGVGGATRLTQSPIIDVVPDLDALRAQGLAPVALDLVQFVAGEQPRPYHKRTFAGLRLPGPGTGSTLQVRAQPGPPGRPFAPAYLDTPLEVTGPLRVTDASGALRFEARTDGSLQVGSLTLKGPDQPQESSWAGIQFPRDPGGGSGDTAFIRYYVAEAESCRLQVGIENDAQDTVALWQMGAERLTVYNGNVGIGVAEPQEKLEVDGNVQIKGSRLKNASGLSILQTNANDWLRINPDDQYPGTAIHKPVAVGDSGLAVGEWTYQPRGRLVVTENALIDGNLGIGTRTPQEKLEVAGNVKINGRYLKNASGLSILLTNEDDWLRINPDFQYPGIALYNTVGIGGGGLSVGDWIPQPKGRLVVTENALIDGDVGIGTRTPGAKLEVIGDVKISGARLKNASGLSILQTNADDWLRINPDSQFSQTALHNSVAIVNGGLAVGELSTQPAGQLSVKGRTLLMGKVGIGTDTIRGMLEVAGDVRISAMLEVAGDVKFSGNRLKDINNYSIINTNNAQYLHINPDGDYTEVNFSSGDVKFSGARLKDANYNAIIETNNTEQRLRLNPDGHYQEIDLGGVKISGDRLRNAFGSAIVDTSSVYWLRLNPDGNYRGTVVLGELAVSGRISEEGTPLSATYAPYSHNHNMLVSEDGACKLVMENRGNLVIFGPLGEVWMTNTSIPDVPPHVGDVQPISGAMEKLRQVRGVSFTRDKEHGTQRELGMLAQEVESVLPELVEALRGQQLSVRYDKFVPVLIQALKEQDERITQLEARLRDLGATT